MLKIKSCVNTSCSSCGYTGTTSTCTGIITLSPIEKLDFEKMRKEERVKFKKLTRIEAKRKVRSR